MSNSQKIPYQEIVAEHFRCLAEKPSDLRVYAIPVLMVAAVLLLFLHSGQISALLHQILVSLEYTLGYDLCSSNQSMIPGLVVKISFLVAILCVCGSYLLSESRREYFQELAESRIIIVLFLSLLLCTSLIPLFSSWCLATPRECTFAGIFPYQDSLLYYNGAEKLLDTGIIDYWNERRPINSILLAARLIIAGFDFNSSLIIQSLFFGVSASLATIMVARKFGWGGGFLFYGILFAFVNLYLPSILSEPLGISLGCLAFVLLLWSVEKRSLEWFFAGCVMLGLALISRTGAMAAIPMVILAGGVIFGAWRGISWRAVLLAILAFATIFAVNIGVITIFGCGEGAMNDNFSDTLYGLSVGKYWTAAHSDIPHEDLTTKQWSERVYRTAFSNIIHHPEVILHTWHKRTVEFGGKVASRFINDLSLFGKYPASDLPRSLLILLMVGVMIIGGLRYIYLNRTDDRFWILTLAVLVGLILSLPVMEDGGTRLTAPVVPFIGAAIVMMLAGLMKTVPVSSETFCTPCNATVTLSVILCIGIIGAFVLTPVVGPLVAKNVIGLPSDFRDTAKCPNETMKMVVRIDPGIPQIQRASGSDPDPTFIPKVNSGDFACLGGIEGFFPPLEPGYAVILAYDYIGKYTRYLIVPNEKLPKNREWIAICAEPMPEYWNCYRLRI